MRLCPLTKSAVRQFLPGFESSISRTEKDLNPYHQQKEFPCGVLIKVQWLHNLKVQMGTGVSSMAWLLAKPFPKFRLG